MNAITWSRKLSSARAGIPSATPFFLCAAQSVKGLPKYQIQRLQSILNCAARLVKRHSKFDRASPLLFELHWLPVEQRITFKILLFVFKSLNGLAPFYLSDLISTYVPSRSLRSASSSCT